MMLARYGSDDALIATTRASAMDVVLAEVRRALVIYPAITAAAFCSALAFGFAYPDWVRPIGEWKPVPIPLNFEMPAGQGCDLGLDPSCVLLSNSLNGPPRLLPRLSSSQRGNG